MASDSAAGREMAAPPVQDGWKLWSSHHGFSRRRVAPQLTWFVLWAAITVICAFLHPNPSGHGTHTQLGLAPCPSVLIWSRPCPACGLTTSFAATVHGDLRHAFVSHPFGPPLYAIFTLSAFVTLIGWIKVRRVELTRLGNWAIAAFVVVYLVFGIIRLSVGPPLKDGGMKAIKDHYGLAGR